MNGPHHPIGIVAGSGSLPLDAAKIITARGGSVHVVMVDGLADPGLEIYPHDTVNWAGLGGAISAFKSAGVQEVIMLGATGRPSFSNARPDWGFISALPSILRLLNAGGDDAVLRGLVALFERNGLRIVGPAEAAPELLIGVDALTRTRPSSASIEDIKFGFELIAALGRFDIGQCAVVTNRTIEAIEAAEGTDRMLKRVAEKRRASGDIAERVGVLVKLPKPGQDLRVDVPTIGPNTVRNASEAGLAGIAVRAGHVLAAERQEMIAIAEALGFFIFGVESGDNASGEVIPAELTALGAVEVPAKAVNDIRRAFGIVTELQAFDTGSAVVIDGRRVLSVGAGEPASEVINRAAGLRKEPSRRRGVAVVSARERIDAALRAAVDAKLEGIAINDSQADGHPDDAIICLANTSGLFLAAPHAILEEGSTAHNRPLKIFLVAGEHSGDALGAKLMQALKAQHQGPIRFSGVGGDEMLHEGLASIFPIEDVAVMGPLSILPRLPRIVRRVYQAVDAALEAKPDVVVIIDSPEFTHPIAKRIRKHAPSIPIIDYVSPSVWAWRPGRAKKMRGYVDHVLALLPFEPDAHERLGGPPCTYVGHPLVDKLQEIKQADASALAARLGLEPHKRPVLLVLPGSRRSEVTRLIDIFGETVARVKAEIGPLDVIIPAVKHVRELIAAKTASWPILPIIVDTEDKYAAMRLARAALAASGTVTLELAIAGTPTVVAYRTDNLSGKLMFLIKVPSVVLANLVLRENVYPEFLQDDCTAEKLSAALVPLFSDNEARRTQLTGLAQIPGELQLTAASPSAAAAEIVLRHAKR